VCYRRLGHNEADEPAATQPLMYKTIRAHAPVRKLYADELQAAGVIAAGDADRMVDQYRQALDDGNHQLHPSLGMIGNKYTVDWTRYSAVDSGEAVRTAVEANRLAALGRRMISYPNTFTLHPRVAQIIVNRARMLNGELPLDWGCAETLAYATLVDDGFAVRLSGQDSGRGTFFHRHAVLHDQGTGESYVPLQHVKERQPRFTVIDSLLSEEAVLGFEYGYSCTSPDCLVIWEGQFGDFVNGAQVLIDQFISSAESKWQRLSGLVLFLPHGYEGQGAEHSSARLERFLQLCAENNMQVCVPSTPAQMFHMLRRQMLRPLRKPLAVMTPKSLLRHELSVSPLSDLATGRFQRLIGETTTTCSPTRCGAWCSAAARCTSTCSRRAAQRSRVMSHWCASNSCIPSRWKSTSRCWRTMPRPANWCGARKNRRTRAPGSRSGIACRRRPAKAGPCSTPGVRPPQRRPPARPSCMKPNKHVWCRRRSALPHPSPPPSRAGYARR
jgi:2-oxoglutarate dehydrogenase E1 component